MKSAFFFYSLFVLTTLISTLGCESQIKKTVYSAYEKVGIYKRDILKDRIEDTKGSQEDAKEEFTSAYDKLKTLYNHDGGDLEAKFRKFSSSYDDAEKRAQRVHTSIAKMDGVANDLFKEWQAEIQEISDSKLQMKSQAKLGQTQTVFRQLSSGLKRSEQKMVPVLQMFKDQTLYLKHNLNAQAIGALKKESVNMESQMGSLMMDMNASIKDLEEFLIEMEDKKTIP